MPEPSTFAAAYYDEVRRSFRGYKRLADGAMAQLSDEEFFQRSRSRIQQRRPGGEAYRRQPALALARLAYHRWREA